MVLNSTFQPYYWLISLAIVLHKDFFEEEKVNGVFLGLGTENQFLFWIGSIYNTTIKENTGTKCSVTLLLNLQAWKTCSPCSPMSEWMILIYRIFLVNQKQKTVSQNKCSKDSVLLSESNANSATSLVWLLHKWLVWAGSSKWIKCI